MRMNEKKSGLECLREEMKKRGCNDTQVRTKGVAVALDILASANANGEMHIYQDIQAAETQLSNVEREISFALAKLGTIERDLVLKRSSAIDEIKQLNVAKAELNNYIEDFKKSLLECETAEGRDRLKAAQMYINTVTVKTGYDNTAFITCLGAILAGQSIGAVKEIKKLNPKLFEKTPVDFMDVGII